jgi:hypothetical protein
LELILSFLILAKGKNSAEHFHEQKQKTVFYAWFARSSDEVGRWTDSRVQLAVSRGRYWLGW